ncbi:MAG: S41 family peptidase [Gemmatimonadetes bacterium]|nr:S41 family peptidase [Gemmatimonadota bacterium]MYK54804.1 S41 family peptidase [Gemmatimonadota bacterium]
MHFLTRIVFLTFLPVLLSCGETLVGSDPANTPQNNFQILWDEFDRYYALFEAKNVDWNALYDIYAPQVTDQTNDRELFDILSAMLTHLNDVHVQLITPFERFNSSYANYPNGKPAGTLNLSLVKRKYLRSDYQTTGNGVFTSGQISDTIGYVHIETFGSDTYQAWVEAIDPIVNEFVDHRGFIVDIRNNSGGHVFNVEAIAGRFADQERLYALSQRRNGPRHSDFAPIHERYVEPVGNKQFNKPIIVLTDRGTISGAEYFVLAMKQFPYVRVVGDFTLGGLSHPLYRTLPNGWTYIISIEKTFSADHVLYEGVGIPPDIHVAISPDDIAMEKDPVIEMAIQLLE